jgi:hypothetical protein
MTDERMALVELLQKSGDGRYSQETIAIRRDLEATIAAADRATVVQAGVGHP